MNKLKKFISAPTVTIAAFILAAVLLLFSTVGGANAALTYFSEAYTSRVQTDNIGVTLRENGEEVAYRDYGEASDGSWNENMGALLENMLDEGEAFKLGTVYNEELDVFNSGTINQYVRVSIRKYWMDAEGNKLTTLSPELIHLNLVNVGSDWIIDEEASTEERTVLYYTKLLQAGESTSLLADGLSIDGIIATKVTQTEEKDGIYTTVTTVYDYDGVQFCIEARADAVQEHNAEAAILSAWGRKVTVADDTLSLD